MPSVSSSKRLLDLDVCLFFRLIARAFGMNSSKSNAASSVRLGTLFEYFDKQNNRRVSFIIKFLNFYNKKLIKSSKLPFNRLIA